MYGSTEDATQVSTVRRAVVDVDGLRVKLVQRGRDELVLGPDDHTLDIVFDPLHTVLSQDGAYQPMMSRHEFAYLPAGHITRLGCVRSKESLRIIFRSGTIENLGMDPDMFRTPLRAIGSDAMIFAATTLLDALVANPDYVEKRKAGQLTRAILVAFRDQLAEQQRPDVSLLVARAAHHVDGQLASSTGLAGIAKAIETTPYRLSRALIEECGITFRRFVESRRTTVAMELIRDGKMALADIASRVGVPSIQDLADLVSADPALHKRTSLAAS